MCVADTVDVVAHLEFLVTRAVKEIREATSREEVPDFANGWFSRRPVVPPTLVTKGHAKL